MVIYEKRLSVPVMPPSVSFFSESESPRLTVCTLRPPSREVVTNMDLSPSAGNIAHPDIASSLHELGNVCESESDYAGARRYFEQSLAMKRAVYGEDEAHPDIAASLHALGNVCYRESDYAGARRYFEQSLAMYQKLTIFGPVNQRSVTSRYMRVSVTL